MAAGCDRLLNPEKFNMPESKDASRPTSGVVSVAAPVGDLCSQRAGTPRQQGSRGYPGVRHVQHEIASNCRGDRRTMRCPTNPPQL